MNRFARSAALAVPFVLTLGCASNERIRKTLREDPSILLSAIQDNPEEFSSAIQRANVEAKKRSAARQLDQAFANPKMPVIDTQRPMRGSLSAPITIVAYSDFQCPYCAVGAKTLEKVRMAYGDKVRVFFKHLPLKRHPEAPLAARYFEAIGLQDGAKAWAFHDAVFSEQSELGVQKEKLLRSAARKVGADMKILAEALRSPEIDKQLAEDAAEAASFGITGTPGFLINGVTISGARPETDFRAIIDRHLTATTTE